MKETPIDWKANYKGIVDVEKHLRATLVHKARIIKALEIENNCYRAALLELAGKQKGENQ